ncbi:caspase family protein [Micromonospora sp. NPDC005979]|uniref:caspase family protein n=1 Tax=Micromonospora sp. NPDC005979 TaxID=3156726 RepID=UPI0033AB0484
MSARLPDRMNSRALIVGVSRFADSAIPDLPAVANNVAALRDALTAPAGVLVPENCRALVNPALPHEVGAAVAELADAPADTVILYYAGHGLLNQQGTLHLAVGDTKRNFETYTAVPMEWLRAALASSPARNRILILDCCFSGRAAEAMSAESSAVSGAIEVYGTYTMTSSPANSTSIAVPGAQFTAFTQELIAVLREGVPGAGHLLTLRDIYPEMVRRLTSRGMPRPQRLGTGLAELIALGHNSAGAAHLDVSPVLKPSLPAAPGRTPAPSEPSEVRASSVPKRPSPHDIEDLARTMTGGQIASLKASKSLDYQQFGRLLANVTALRSFDEVVEIAFALIDAGERDNAGWLLGVVSQSILRWEEVAHRLIELRERGAREYWVIWVKSMRNCIGRNDIARQFKAAGADVESRLVQSNGAVT